MNKERAEVSPPCILFRLFRRYGLDFFLDLPGKQRNNKANYVGQKQDDAGDAAEPMKKKAMHGLPDGQGADVHYHNQGSDLAEQMVGGHALCERRREDVKQCGAAQYLC